MGIIRLVLLIAAIWLAWRLFKQVFLSNSRPDMDNGTDDNETPPANAPEAMLRCDQCGVHTPTSDAFTVKGHHFCSSEHQQLWLEQHDRD